MTPEGIVRCNINASLQTGEIMVHTVHMRKDTSAFLPVDLQSVADKVRDEWTRTINADTGDPVGIGNKLTTSCQYLNVTAYLIGPLGKAVAQAEAAFAATVKGQGTSHLPPQLALVVTLLTNRSGRSGRGRIYLGGLQAATNGTDGRVSAANRTIFVQALSGFYTRLRDLPFANDQIRPVVVSPTTTSSAKITKVSVGDVIDTMRSRRNALVEAKEFATVDSGDGL
jgi:hypothetical protein